MKKLSWIPQQIDYSGDGYTELIDHDNGAAHYGVWICLCGIAARCSPRGDLVRSNGSPHDAASISRITRIPESTIKEALPRLVAIGGLAADVGLDNEVTDSTSVAGHSSKAPCHESDGGTSPDCQADVTAVKRHVTAVTSKEEKERIERKGIEQKEPAAADAAGPCGAEPSEEDRQAESLYEAYPRKVAKQDALKAIKKALKRATFDELMDAVLEYAECRRSSGADPSFTPHPATWFNGSRWLDDRGEWRRADSQARAGPGSKATMSHSGVKSWLEGGGDGPS